MYFHYEQTLQEAYDALTTVEDALTSIGMKLEYEHFRIGGAVDELKPLMILPQSKTDNVMEEFEKATPITYKAPPHLYLQETTALATIA